jgi:hypothetical protein
MSVPSGPHTDWPWPFRFIPRKWTAVPSTTPPKQLAGNTTGNLDVPKPGEWTVAWPPYVAYTSPSGLHFRLGARFDYNDAYYQIPAFTVKRIGEKKAPEAGA